MEHPAKIFMKHIWRFGQVGGIVSVVLMCLNLTIPLYELTGWRFHTLGVPPKLDWLIGLILFFFVFMLAFVFGILYDRVFKLWKHREVVGMERNPYQKGRITPNELILWQYSFIPLLIKNGLIAEAEFNLKWNERNMERDPQFREDVYRIMKWIKMYKLKDIDERWLDEMTNITEKKYKDKYGKLKPDW